MIMTSWDEVVTHKWDCPLPTRGGTCSPECGAIKINTATGPELTTCPKCGSTGPKGPCSWCAEAEAVGNG